MSRPKDSTAAPPDAGGHLGAFSTPEDVRQAGPESGPQPKLHEKAPVRELREQSKGPRVMPWLIGGAIVLAFVVVAVVSLFR